MNFFNLDDNHKMPKLGFGVWQIPQATTEQAVLDAIATGYRLIDTAAIYGNEVEVGRAVKKAQIERKDLFITTKLWYDNYENPEKGINESLAKLNLDYVDLYLIHWPAPKLGIYVKVWEALIKIKQQGKALNIGVANFNPDHLQDIIQATGVAPAVNQIELHPLLTQQTLVDFHKQHRIVTQAYSPLAQAHAQLFGAETIKQLAQKYHKSVAQIILRWHLDAGYSAIPKSQHAGRIKENFDLFDFNLTAEEVQAVTKINQNLRTGFDPLSFP